MLLNRHLNVALCSIGLIASSCAFIVDDGPDTYADTVYHWPESTRYDFDQCDNSGSFSYCAADAASSHQYAWKPNCQSEDCQAVSLFVHYAVDKDLGPNATLWVEAFDNPYFNGAALSTFRMSSFDTSGPSSSAREEMYLDPGEYYLRAYVSNASAAPLPNDLQGLEPEDSAIGVYGALSQPERVVIKRNEQIGAVHITVDQLLSDPTVPVATGAKLKTTITTEDEVITPNNRNIILNLLKNPDIDEAAQYTFRTSSNDLLVDRDEPQAEIVTSDLEPGSYYAFVFIDEDGDEYFDYGEPAAFHKRYGEPWPIDIKEDFTARLEMILSIYPELP